MKGTSHLAIGAATGFLISSYAQVDPENTVALVALGGISGLVPDLDIDGKLRNKLTFPHKTIQIASALIGIILMLYSYLTFEGSRDYFLAGIGFIILLFASMFQKKHLLLITALGIIIGGYFLGVKWILLSGIYMLVASMSPHRSYTHSLLGLCLFGWMIYELVNVIPFYGVFETCIFSYISHLVADSKLIPFQKQGVPLLLPITKRKF